MNDPRPPQQFGMTDVLVSKALMSLRIIWFALLMGPVFFLVALVALVLPHHKQSHPPVQVLFWANIIMLVTVVPVTFFIRSTIFNRSAARDGIPIGAYSTGNIIFWAGCEGVAFFGLVIAMLNGTLWPTIAIAAIAWALQVLTFPLTGKVSAGHDSSGGQDV